LWTALAAAAANSPALTLRVSSETALPGGSAQIKVFASAPALIASGQLTMDFDPALFGPIAQVAVFSATGDQIGYAIVNDRHLEAHFTSASAAIGQLPVLPILVVNLPVLPSAPPGSTSSLTADPLLTTVTPGTPWLDPQGNHYSVSVVAGSFTVSGRLSVESVTPGGGNAPAGTILQVTGTGFDSAMSVAVDGVKVDSVRFISPQRIEVTLGGATELTGKHFHLRSASGESANFFAALPSAPSDPGPEFYTPSSLHPILPFSVSTGAYVVQPLDQRFGFAVALQNQNLAPIVISVEVAGTNTPNQVYFFRKVTLAPGELYFPLGRLVDPPPVFSGVWLTASVPVRFLQYSFGFPASVSASFPPLTPEPPPVQFHPSSTSASLSWRLGAPPNFPYPQTDVLLLGAYDFSLSTTTTGGNWLSVTSAPLNPESTGATVLTFTADPSKLAAGVYTGTVTVTPVVPSAIAGAPVALTTIGVVLTVTGPPSGAAQVATPSSLLQPDPNVLSFELATGSPSTSLPTTITFQPDAVLTSAQAQSDRGWLSVIPYNNFIGAYANDSAVGFPPGVYHGSITVTSSNYGSVVIPATLTVFPQPTGQTMLTATPPSLSFIAPAGGSGPPQTLMIQFNGDPVLFNLKGSPGLSFQRVPGYSSAQPAFTVSAAATDARPGTYQDELTIVWSTGSTSVPVTLNIAPTPAFPPIIASLVNGASQSPGLAAPGEIITILGTGLGPVSTKVLIDGLVCRLIYASASQVNAVIPLEIASAGVATVQVVSNGAASEYWEIPMAPTAAGIFTVSSTGVGQAAVLNQDNSANGATSPATRGSVIQIFATGRGVAPSLPAKVTIGGINAAVQYSGPAPGEVEGLIQVNAIVPPAVAPGSSVPISVTFGDTRSQDGVTIAVR
jgi:uncharacterized protein (TIGR03437 family)